jgi:hypothetical protein
MFVNVILNVNVCIYEICVFCKCLKWTKNRGFLPLLNSLMLDDFIKPSDISQYYIRRLNEGSSDIS